jgi:transposase
MSRSLFWLSDEAWAAIEPHLPRNQPGARRVDGRRVISGIIHMLKCSRRWADVPPEHGPPTTVCNRWNRRSRRGIRTRIRAALTEEGWFAETAQIDSSHIKVHRCAGGAEWGAKERHRHLSGRSYNQGPKSASGARGCHRVPAPPRPDARQHLRHQER